LQFDDLTTDDEFDDLLDASSSSIGFWINPDDDQDWNNA
jgi:hypothetical protein